MLFASILSVLVLHSGSKAGGERSVSSETPLGEASQGVWRDQERSFHHRRLQEPSALNLHRGRLPAHRGALEGAHHARDQVSRSQGQFRKIEFLAGLPGLESSLRL